VGLLSYSCPLEEITEGATEVGKGTNETETGLGTKVGMETTGVAELQTVMRRDAQVGRAVHVRGTEIRTGTGTGKVLYICFSLMKSSHSFVFRPSRQGLRLQT